MEIYPQGSGRQSASPVSLQLVSAPCAAPPQVEPAEFPISAEFLTAAPNSPPPSREAKLPVMTQLETTASTVSHQISPPDRFLKSSPEDCVAPLVMERPVSTAPLVRYTQRTAASPFVVPGTWQPRMRVSSGPLTLCTVTGVVTPHLVAHPMHRPISRLTHAILHQCVFGNDGQARASSSSPGMTFLRRPKRYPRGGESDHPQSSVCAPAGGQKARSGP